MLCKPVLALAPALALTCVVVAVGLGGTKRLFSEAKQPVTRVTCAHFAINGTILKDPDSFQ